MIRRLWQSSLSLILSQKLFLTKELTYKIDSAEYSGGQGKLTCTSLDLRFRQDGRF
jgi:hypothetical protein